MSEFENKKANVMLLFTWIVFIELNLTVAFLFIRKIAFLLIRMIDLLLRWEDQRF